MKFFPDNMGTKFWIWFQVFCFLVLIANILKWCGCVNSKPRVQKTIEVTND